MVITVKFSCHGCGLVNVPVVVPARGRDQDVVVWMQLAAVYCGSRHRELSPACREPHCDFLIPFPANEDDGLGMSAAPKDVN